MRTVMELPKRMNNLMKYFILQIRSNSVVGRLRMVSFFQNLPPFQLFFLDGCVLKHDILWSFRTPKIERDVLRVPPIYLFSTSFLFI